MALHPPRILRSVIDYKISNPKLEEQTFLFLQEAIDYTLLLYSNPEMTQEINNNNKRLCPEYHFSDGVDSS